MSRRSPRLGYDLPHSLAALGSQLGIVLTDAAQIERKQPELQGDESVSSIMQAPRDPQDVAGDEAPEPDSSLSIRLRRHQPRCRERNDHRWPLQSVQDFVQESSTERLILKIVARGEKRPVVELGSGGRLPTACDLCLYSRLTTTFPRARPSSR